MQKLLELWLESKLQTQVYRKENFTTITWSEIYFYPALLLEVLMSPFLGGCFPKMFHEAFQTLNLKAYVYIGTVKNRDRSLWWVRVVYLMLSEQK